MRLLEFEGKCVLRSQGLRVPAGSIASTPREAAEAAMRLRAERVAVKAQVPFGGRGKAGLIRVAAPGEAEAAASAILGRKVHDVLIERVLIEEALDSEKEFYLAVYADCASGRPVLLFSEAGGVDVEEATRSGHAMFRYDLDPAARPAEHSVRTFLRKAGLRGKVLTGVTGAALGLARAFHGFDTLLAEVNPLALLKDGTIAALDAKVELDDSAAKRWTPKLREAGLSCLHEDMRDLLEKEAAEIGVTYVRLDGEVGVIASGAGLGMCTMDLILKHGLRPANFLETGGGITRDLMRRSVGLVAKHPSVRGIAVNLYGGVNPLVDAAQGVADGVADLRKQGRALPVVVKALGNRQEEAWNVLREAGIMTETTVHSEAAVAALCAMLAGEPAGEVAG